VANEHWFLDKDPLSKFVKIMGLAINLQNQSIELACQTHLGLILLMLLCVVVNFDKSMKHNVKIYQWKWCDKMLDRVQNVEHHVMTNNQLPLQQTRCNSNMKTHMSKNAHTVMTQKQKNETPIWYNVTWRGHTSVSTKGSLILSNSISRMNMRGRQTDRQTHTELV